MLDTESDGYYSDSDDGSEIADNIIPDDDTLWEPDSIVNEAPPQPLCRKFPKLVIICYHRL